MKISILRDAVVRPPAVEGRGFLLGLHRVQEAVGQLDVTNPTIYSAQGSYETPLSLQPGTIYRGFTGIGVLDIPFRNLAITPSRAAMLQAGFQVVYVEQAATTNELLVYFTVIKPWRFTAGANVFEIGVVGVVEARPIDIETASEPIKDQRGLEVQVKETRTIPTMYVAGDRAVRPPTVDANAWLNTPDTRPGQVLPDNAANPVLRADLPGPGKAINLTL